MDGGSINVTSITTGKATGIDTSRAEGTTLNLGDNTQIEVNSGAGEAVVSISVQTQRSMQMVYSLMLQHLMQ